MKEEGEALDLLERIAGDESFGLSLDDLQELSDPRKFIGRAPEQVTRFLEEKVEPLLARTKERIQPISEPEVHV